MLTDPGDLVVDPFAGSCVTGEVCERLGRRWICLELVEQYLQGALGRFQKPKKSVAPKQEDLFGATNVPEAYKVHRPGLLWNGNTKDRLAADGGKVRRIGNSASRRTAVERK
ncbi:MAG: DNA methyltransferase [Candidatus Acidiferrales bacterium]